MMGSSASQEGAQADDIAVEFGDRSGQLSQNPFAVASLYRYPQTLLASS